MPLSSVLMSAGRSIGIAKTSSNQKTVLNYEHDQGSEVIEGEELQQLLLPGGSFPTGPETRGFALVYSSAVFDGWVNQPSPCCAAASIAGAWNIVHRLRRDDSKALGASDVLEVLNEILQGQVRTKTKEFERVFKVSPAPLIQALEKKLALEGRTLGGKAEAGPGGKGHVIALVREIVAERVASGSDQGTRDEIEDSCSGNNEENGENRSTEANSGNVSGALQTCFSGCFSKGGAPGTSGPEDIFHRIAEIIASEEANQRNRKPAHWQNQSGQGSSSAGEDTDDDKDADADGEDETEMEVEAEVNKAVEARVGTASQGSMIAPKPPKLPAPSMAGGSGANVRRAASGSGRPNSGRSSSSCGGSVTMAARRRKSGDSSFHGWTDTLWLLVKKVGGMNKLQRQFPSTGAFGNWGITRGLKLLSNVHSSFFMGARTRAGNKCQVELQQTDNEMDKAAQFARLRTLLLEPRTALIFHLSNHYALIYGVREWRSADGSSVRQVLTARKGQRPTAWIDFDEVRDIMLNSQSYKIMAVTCKTSSSIKQKAAGVVRKGSRGPSPRFS